VSHGSFLIAASARTWAPITVHNGDPKVAEDLREGIFGYGVSDSNDAAAQGSRGKGLVVAKIGLAMMGGTITTRKEENGAASCRA
jgi:hypothetical protein